MPNMGEEATISSFKDVFTRFGYLTHLVTDNFPTFVGDTFKTVMSKAGIRHSPIVKNS